ncbi:MAG: dihydroxyacetone kinase subunit DhaK [Bacteroidales bacterium]|nr:dihydroxyacetone kinase subunit DhaK [Bacteroidales bacterium]
MKKIINDPKNFVNEMLEGILVAHQDQLKYLNDDFRSLLRSDVTKKNKVGLMTGGGSGHLPLFLGYVGKGMLDACAVGGVFASPSAKTMFELTKAIDNGAGVIYIFGNYGGDVINFNMSEEMAKIEGIRIEQVIGNDDVASAPKGSENDRRGVAGIFFIYKIAGAYAEEMASIDEVKRIAEKARINTRTMGVGLSPCILPEIGKPTFEIGEDDMEVGIGIHGEAGIKKGKLESADEIAEDIMGKILADYSFNSGDEVSVLINGLGATPKEELYIIYRKIFKILNSKGINVFHPYIGEFATSLEMSGISISLLKLDDELKYFLSKPAKTPFFEQAQL